MSKLWDRIKQVRVEEGYDGLDPIPEGAFVAEEYAQKFPVKGEDGKLRPIARGTAVAQCRALVRKGIFATGYQMRYNGGRHQLSRVYWLKEAPREVKSPVEAPVRVGRSNPKRGRGNPGRRVSGD